MKIPVNQDCIEQALQLRDSLSHHEARIAFAESCTAGRITATLGAIPGISSWLCGGFVIYRNDSKSKWLGIPDSLLDDPAVGPVSAEVTRLLAQSVAQRTPEARFSVAVTGDIGPGAPAVTDGTCFCAVVDSQFQQTYETTFQLQAPPPTGATDIHGRLRRLDEATFLVLSFAQRIINLRR